MSFFREKEGVILNTPVENLNVQSVQCMNFFRELASWSQVRNDRKIILIQVNKCKCSKIKNNEGFITFVVFVLVIFGLLSKIYRNNWSKIMIKISSLISGFSVAVKYVPLIWNHQVVPNILVKSTHFLIIWTPCVYHTHHQTPEQMFTDQLCISLDMGQFGLFTG